MVMFILYYLYSNITYIVPDSFNFTPSKYFKFGKYIGVVSHLQILASELSDRMLAELLDIDDNINISFHIKAVEQMEAIKMVKRKNTDIDKMKIMFRLINYFASQYKFPEDEENIQKLILNLLKKY